MRTFIATSLLGFCALVTLHAQPRPADDHVFGTWTGPVECLHGGGDTFAMSITRDASGKVTGTMNWALATSDGRSGPATPFTTLAVDGPTIAATGKVGGRTAHLTATVEDETIKGSWRTDGGDTWTFTGKKR